MAVQGLPADNNQTVIMRAGNVGADNVTSLALGKVQGTDTQNTATDVVSRDAAIAQGEGPQNNAINSQLQYTSIRTLAASGYDIHGNYVEGNGTTDVVTYATDEAANDGRGDGGEFYWNRGTAANRVEKSIDAPTG